MRDKIDGILKAFGNYIRGHNDFDIVYSEKLGYVSLQMQHLSGRAPEVLNIPEVLKTPEALLDVLFNEIINDVVFSPDNPRQEHDDPTLSEYEKAESCRRIAEILETMGDEDKTRYLAFMSTYVKEYPRNGEYSAG